MMDLELEHYKLLERVEAHIDIKFLDIGLEKGRIFKNTP